MNSSDTFQIPGSNLPRCQLRLSRKIKLAGPKQKDGALGGFRDLNQTAHFFSALPEDKII